MEDVITASQATTNGSECVPESESEHEKEDGIIENKNEVIEILDSQPSPAVLKKQQTPPATLTRSSSTHGSGDEFSIGTTDSDKKEPTARELRRRNRNSLTLWLLEPAYTQVLHGLPNTKGSSKIPDAKYCYSVPG
ncbi:hypothetical protein BBO99_00005732 [Phytophthora kernoviae]|uniref:Uncharacterized protein n=2 Tax=Phytophthora kernoviae TaxID=325452 RepID=A0A3R7GVP6_9STRA|nr:hypothetical protein G195_006241 [Phytophthora kernoviae 00238/432]KAG2520136.1 hypothetical protein JM16_006861 [Phytophthora kernoviae]KAG2525249.1 hypothetical protein JM18_004991 [Phytophthora kernoviae]RLN36975.1 hypothetical protein BBI17_005746 [Phytophthora kernoviae]RLN78791.1 hypothetical protein BBO99_00005732 [Phytophthora kernoviae]